ncbi:Pisatin demethylase [Tolypocladium ophioglossoides CBS 100239]|uniref:Pisatin demethylase n=1 Tax=Tolypocladium ophioglossoides (strain CBS 100239) TaxID=1163406 RepID=A0A0L0N1Y8_TOLOC|nr:Pisatin demethylase [Tolypocladium ophioglossoides CBS 100239]
MMSWLLATLTALLALFLTHGLRCFLRLRHIPGPTLAAWTDLWMVRSQLTGRMHLVLHDLTKKHGPIARIAPNWVVCGDPSELRRIWAVRSSWTRSWWYRGMRIDPYRDSSFSTIDDNLHTAIRNKLLPGYGGKDVDNLHQLIDEQVKNLTNLIDKHLSENGGSRVIDLAEKIQYFSLDVISSLAFGKAFGYMEADQDKFRYIETTGKTVYILVSTTLIPGVITMLQSPYLKWIIPSVKDMGGIGEVIKLAEEVVAERYGDDRIVKRDMLGSFVAHGLSQKDTEAEALVQIIAGSDTTATAIRSTMLFIITSPQVYIRFRAEIDTAIREGRISSPITNSEAQAFEYLQAVILEGLRLWPPAAALYPKVSNKDEIVCGVHIPAGTNVAWSPWTIMRSKDIFGENAELFCPDRWLGAKKSRRMEQTVMMAFAAGSRWECLGRNIATIELNKVFVELFRRFDFTLADPMNPWKSFNAGLFSQSNLNVHIARRTSPS